MKKYLPVILGIILTACLVACGSSNEDSVNDDNCRANQEMNDESARPAISNDLSVVSEYDVIYLGYPIWWGTAPRII